MIGRDTFSALAPVPFAYKSSYVTLFRRSWRYDTKYVTFEMLLHAAFVADEIWGLMFEPARRAYTAQDLF